MNRTDFIKRYAKEYNIDQNMSKEVCDSVFDLLNNVLLQGEDVYLYGFGAFKQKTMKEKKFKHPGTGLIGTIPAKRVVMFKKELSNIETTE